MPAKKNIKNTGIRGVKVADSYICKVDGQKGVLYYRGYSIYDLARDSSYEEVVYLLIYGDLPTISQLNEIKSQLISNRQISGEIVSFLQAIPKSTSAMGVLQSILSILSGYDLELSDVSKDANCRKAIRIISILPTIVAAYERIRNGNSPISPDSSLSHAANFLFMLTGKKPTAEIARYFDIALILHAEHSFNNSTFTGRVIASTQADIYASLAGASGSLSGVLHGGANSAVMRNLLEIGEVSNVDSWVKKQFDENKVIMGMGHAVYRTMDPRATILKDIAGSLSRKSNNIGSKLIKITNKMVEATQAEFKKRKGGREIFPNVDCYTSSVYTAMEIPMEIFTAIFTMSRAAGWAAHFLEQQHPESPDIKPALYRPTCDFIGSTDRKYTPLQNRGSTGGSVQGQMRPGSIRAGNQHGDIQTVVRQVVSRVVYNLLDDKTPSSSRSKFTPKSQSKVIKRSELITEYDIEDLSNNGITLLSIEGGAIVTPLARDKARDLGIEIIFKE